LDGAIARGFRRPNLFDQAQFSIVTEFAIGRVHSYRSLAPDLGDEQKIVKVGPMRSPIHDRCALAQLGEGILNLPEDERAKFTLAAVGTDMMKRLVKDGERP
jgi:hypothetical protein